LGRWRAVGGIDGWGLWEGRGEEGRRKERNDGGWGFSVRLLAEAEVKGRIQGKRQEKEERIDVCVCLFKVFDCV
jgi:hypothetical protein